MTFEVQHTDNASDARAGLITTDHGTIKTPIFMPARTGKSSDYSWQHISFIFASRT